MPRPHPTHIPLPPPSATLQPQQFALHQHTPSPSAEVQREWEPGRQPDAVYAAVLAPWRDNLRRTLVARLEKESRWIADWQARVRTTTRDRYFHWTSIFGTHTFFMTFLPLLFFLGYPAKGRGLLHVVGLGIYVSCFSKDLVCTPRPYSPPVTRLTMSTHHHEYGFPSSHSTNSSSIALYIGAWLWTERETVGLTGVLIGWAILAVYAASIIGGRVYTGMHSIADIVGGTLMGTACWVLWVAVGDSVEGWVRSTSVTVPLIMVPVTLAMVRYHPEPVDDCPCFEDAIAILSVILGSFLGHWSNSFIDPTEVNLYLRPLEVYTPLWATAISSARIVFGIVVMFSWRLVVKAVLLRVLPPIFRALASRVDLPNRRHYVPATDYAGMPPTPLRAIPSFIDMQSDSVTLPSPSPSPSPSLDPPNTSSSATSSAVSDSLAFRRESSSSMFSETLERRASSSSALEVPGSADPGIELRSRKIENGGAGGGGRSGHASPSPNGDRARGKIGTAGASQVQGAKGKKRTVPRERYDAEVLTKVVVYTGIGILATTVLPRLFTYVERDHLRLDL